MLILAGVTVATLTGDNGLLTKAESAKQTEMKASEKEKIQVELLGAYNTKGKLDAGKLVTNINNNISNATAEATSNSFPVKIIYNNGHKYQVASDGSIMISIDAGDTAPSDANAVYSSGSHTAVILAGFTVSNATEETSIENGLVVRDKSQNEWVWIPVSSTDLAKMYESGNTEYTLLGTNVKTTYKSKGTTVGNRTISRTNPGTTSNFREPDVLSSSDTEQSYRTQAGFGNLTDMATKLRDDYRDMIESVKTNGGFYVGRYEISGTVDTPMEKKSQTVLANQNWYILYKACKSFSSEKVESRMIWGCQWNHVCRFISSYKNSNNGTVTRNLDNSTTYGNYKNSASPANVTGYNSTQVTGYSEYWKTNNIYDLAGNYWELSQETYGGSGRELCGGRCTTDGIEYSVSSCSIGNPIDSISNISSRPILYIK